MDEPPRIDSLSVAQGGWKHPASGIAFPREIGGFERQSAEELGAHTVAVDYRFTSRISDSLRGFVDVRVIVLPAVKAPLAAVFTASTPVVGRYFFSGLPRTKSGDIPAAEGLAGHPGYLAEYRRPSMGANGYNEDCIERVEGYQHGDFLVFCVVSYAEVRAELSQQALRRFRQAFPW